MIDQSNPESRSRFGMYLRPIPQTSVSYERLPPTRNSVRNTTLVAAAQAGWPAAGQTVPAGAPGTGRPRICVAAGSGSRSTAAVIPAVNPPPRRASTSPVTLWFTIRVEWS